MTIKVFILIAVITLASSVFYNGHAMKKMVKFNLYIYKLLNHIIKKG